MENIETDTSITTLGDQVIQLTRARWGSDHAQLTGLRRDPLTTPAGTQANRWTDFVPPSRE